MAQGRVFIISAPSGAGKTTVLSKVMTQIEGLSFSISHTTRAPRKGELDGREYHFVSREEFEGMRKDDVFVESAEVHGNLYGTSKNGLKEQIENGGDVILDIDVQGARIIMADHALEATYIFLAPPDLGELERRLRSRASDDEETIVRRLNNARQEMAAIDEYDYLIVNDVVEDATALVKAIILAERARSRRDITGASLVVNGEIL